MKIKASRALSFGPILLFFWVSGLAGAYEMMWSTIDTGGKTSSGPQYTVSGTIGQHDSDEIMRKNTYTLVGGFWGGSNFLLHDEITSFMVTKVSPIATEFTWNARPNFYYNIYVASEQTEGYFVLMYRHQRPPVSHYMEYTPGDNWYIVEPSSYSE